MAKKPLDTDTIMYVRISSKLAKKLDRRVERERRDRSEDVTAGSVSRSSVIRQAVVMMLEKDGGR